MLKRLNDEQKKAVLHKDGPLLIIAGAGSGKTGVITTRIVHLINEGVSPYNILAVTFTNKAAREMKERVSSMLKVPAKNLMVSTFHALCMRILKLEIEKLGYKKSFTLYVRSDQIALMRNILREIRVDINHFDENRFLSVIDSWKNSFIFPDEITPQNQFEEWAIEAYRLYQKYLRGYNALDFNDLINLTVIIFEKFPEILEKYQNRFRYIMVDEYQDTNASQYRLISLLADKYKNLVVVGDDDQSIYAFRGADISNILSFENDYPNSKVVYLERNYRSTAEILNVANSLIANNSSRRSKRLFTETVDGRLPRIVTLEDDRKEAVFVAESIFNDCALKNARWKDFCILFRVNAQSRPFEEELRVRRIPYKVVGGFEFYERKEIKDIVSYLNLFVNPEDEISLLRIINFPRRGIGDGSVTKLTEYSIKNSISLYETLLIAPKIEGIPKRAQDGIVELIKTIQKYNEIFTDTDVKIDIAKTIEKMLEEIDHTTEILNTSDTKDKASRKLENVESLMRGIEEYEKSVKKPTLKGYLDAIALMKDEDEDDKDKNEVTLLTVHASKGLEFPFVYLVGMEDGYLPHFRSLEEGEEAVCEERRLCYVAITRAKKELTMTYALGRSVRGKKIETKPSQFLTEIPPDLVSSEGSGEIDSGEGDGAGFEFYKRMREENAGA